MHIIQEIIYILFIRRWLLLAPLILGPVFTVIFLFFVEPIYVSHAKIWIRERPEESFVLKTKKEGVQDETHIMVQREILTSYPVMKKVIDRLGLLYPVPSQSMYARLTGAQEEPLPPDWDPVEAEYEAVKDLRERIRLLVLNPEVIEITTMMNEANLSRNVATEIIRAYQETYLGILQDEVYLARNFLEGRLDNLRSNVDSKEDTLLSFQEKNPEILAALSSREIGKVENFFPPEATAEVEDYSPISEVLRQQALLQMRLNRLMTVSSPDNFELQRVEEEISRNQKLINSYQRNLAMQAKLSVKYKDLLWGLQEERTRYNFALNELDKVVISQETKAQQASMVTVLEKPSFNPRPTSPKKKVSLFAAIFLSSIVGMALIYILQLLDNTYHLASQVRRGTSLPVLGEIYLEDEQAIDSRDHE